MEATIAITAILFGLVGIVGSVLPGPGPPLVYVGMLLMQWQFRPYSATLLWVLAILNVLLLVLDYLIPIWVGKKFGASSYGVWGSIIGMVMGIFFTPLGMVLGLLLGAIAGEVIYGRTHADALKAGVGTLVGTLVAIVVKLGLAAVMFYHIVRACYALL